MSLNVPRPVPRRRPVGVLGPVLLVLLRLLLLARLVVLMPLAELAPDLMIEGRTVRHWLAQLDVSGIEPVSDDGEWWHRL